MVVLLEVRLIQMKDKDDVLKLCNDEGEDFTDVYMEMLSYYYDFEVEHMYGVFVFGELAGLATTGYNDDYYIPDEADFNKFRVLGLDNTAVDCFDEYLVISNVYIAKTHRGKSLANCLIEGIINQVNTACVIHPICDKVKDYYLKCESVFESSYEPTILLGLKVK